HPGSLLDSSVQMGSFGGVPDSHVWSQEFLMESGGNDQNMQNNFSPHLNEVLCNSRSLRQDEQQLLSQECDQNHLKKMEEMSSGWELRSQLTPNFQPEDSLSLSNSIAGKHQIPSLSTFSLQVLDDRLQNACSLSDIGSSWSMSPSSYTHSGLDMSILPQFHLGTVKEEYNPIATYSTTNSPTTFLQAFGPPDPYKTNESGLTNMLESHGSKTILKSHHLVPMNPDYSVHHAHAFLPPIPSKLLTFGNSNCLNMPVMDFMNSKPTDMRIQRPHSSYLQEGKQKLHNSHQNRSMQSLHGGPDSISDQKRSSSSGHESTSDVVFKRPRLETNSSLSTFKVRKEKLGDRITALQQLVSPFGKTDTASVLLEAIGYIKFLQEQVRALSMPYMKTGCSSTAQGDQKGWGSSEQKDSNEARQDLRSRGLCLVPLSCTLHVANDNGADYWSPSLG
ncbi:hypothetical protein KI387_021916, partial [Taxus chinensis]